MILTRELFAFLTCTNVMVFYCEADRLPPPTGLSYKWLDPFTINVSWLKPTSLPVNCTIKYKVQSWKETTRTIWRNITDTCMTEEMGSAAFRYTIHTVSSKPCDRNASTPVTINIPVPRAEVVKDFKCIAYSDKMNCSWIPVNQSLNLTLSYRICGNSEEVRKSLKLCDQLYSTGTRSGCYLKGDIYKEDICVVVSTEAGWSSFKLSYEIPPPKLSVSEEGDRLKLSWTPLEVKQSCGWIYEVCYRQCNEPKVCKNFTEEGQTVAYDKRCRYEFQSRAMTNEYCKTIHSDFTEVVAYGTDEPPDGTLTVVAIVIPIILSICVILSCYCFRRHRAIICPIIPDPSAIFKEMMMNGNKELKTTAGSLYTPVPEPIEPCKITLVPENGVLQQNS